MDPIKNMEGSTRSSQDMEIFKVVTDHFKQDIREFWARSNFYLLAQAGLFSVFVATHSTSTRFEIAVSVSIAILGLVIAIFWFVVLRGAIEWLRRWREQVVKLDKELDRFQCYAEVEAFAEQRPFLSPSFVTKFLPLVFVIAWLTVLSLIFTAK